MPGHRREPPRAFAPQRGPAPKPACAGPVPDFGVPAATAPGRPHRAIAAIGKAAAPARREIAHAASATVVELMTYCDAA